MQRQKERKAKCFVEGLVLRAGTAEASEGRNHGQTNKFHAIDEGWRGGDMPDRASSRRWERPRCAWTKGRVAAGGCTGTIGLLVVKGRICSLSQKAFFLRDS